MNNFKVDPFPFRTENNNSETMVFPQPLRCLIVDLSGAGKTTLFRIIIIKNRALFENIYIFAISTYLGSNYRNIIYFNRRIVEVIFSNFSNDTDIINVDGCKPKNLVVFDSCTIENQSKFIEYFT